MKHVEENNQELLKDINLFVQRYEKIGNPRKALFSSYSEIEMSPTTARYIKVLSDLEILFGSLEGMDIVEIGGGYGGLATVIETKYKFNSYYNIDLKEAAELSEKYCSENNVENFFAIPPENVRSAFEGKNIDLVISNYAFSECNTETQDIYIKHIFDVSRMGYVTHNTHPDRADRVRQIVKKYDHFLDYGTDLSRKNHPIITWGSKKRG